jgi:mono/diheme cytochrome c family protein
MKRNLRTYASLAGLALVSSLYQHSFARNPLEGSSRKSSTRGASLFRKSCAVCHSVRPGETKVGPSLYAVLRQDSGNSEQAVRQTIAAGKAGMPAFQQKLEPDQMDDLIEYLRTL